MIRFLPLLLIPLLAGCAPRGDDRWGADALARLTVRQRAAQLLVVPVDSAAPRRVRLLGVGGVQLRAGHAEAARGQVSALQTAAARPLLVVADLDRGVGGVLGGATELPPAELLSRELAADAADLAAEEAERVGINLARVAGPAAAPSPAGSAREWFAAALAERGLPPIIGAFAAADTAPLGWDRAALEAGPLRSLRGARRWAAGVELAWVTVPSLTGDTVPLPLSAVAHAGLLRRDLAFEGLAVADLTPGSAWRRRFGPRAPLAAVTAGADLLLGVEDPSAAVDSLAAAVADGRLPQSRLLASAARVFALKARLRLAPPPAPEDPPRAPPPVVGREAGEVAERLHAAALRQAGAPAELLRRCRSAVMASRRPRTVRALAAEIPAARLVRADSVPLRGDPGWGGGSPDCVVVVSIGGDGPAVVAGRDSVAGDSAAPPRRVIRAVLGEAAVDSAPAWAWAGGTGPAAQRLLGRLLAGRVAVPAASWPPAPVLMRAVPESAGMQPDSLEAIDRVMRAALDGDVFTGAVVAVARRGRLVKLTGYGRTSGRPVVPESTLFDLASLTKVVGTTAAAMTLVDDGEMELNAPLRRYLSGYRGGDRGDVTVRQLLTHTAGLPAGANLYGSRSEDAALRRVARAELIEEPGSSYRYSDFGMILLADAIGALAGEPIDQLLARRVYAPLGLEATGYRPSVLLQDRTVPTALRSERPYVLDAVVHDGNAFRLGGVAGHAGVFSTAADVAVFAQTILNGGAYGDRRIWSARTVRAFATPQRVPGGRALGWDVVAARSSAGDYFSASTIGHTGYTGTSLWIDPERQLFVVLLTNRTFDRGSAGQIYNVRRRVHDLAARSISDTRILPRPGTAAARAAERPRARRRR